MMKNLEKRLTRLEKRQEFIKLRGMGESYDKVAEQIGVSKPTLISWSRLYAPELSEAKLKVLDNVIEEFDLAKSGRLKIVAKELARLDAELGKRDLASIPTSKLIQIKLRALEVVGDILDSKKIEIDGNMNIQKDPWELIMQRCLKVDMSSLSEDDILAELEKRNIGGSNGNH